MTTAKEMTARYDVLLAEHDLPSMSADDLWHEIIAIRDGEASYTIDAAWRAARTREQVQAIADAVMVFWRAWDEAADANPAFWEI